jgi:hypothetical protein
MQHAADSFSALVKEADELAVINGVAEFMLWGEFTPQLAVQIKVRIFAERKKQAGIALEEQGQCSTRVVETVVEAAARAAGFMLVRLAEMDGISGGLLHEIVIF